MKKIVAVLALAVPSISFAALPSGVSDAISGAGTDASTALGLMIVVAVGIWALRKVVRLFGN